jgi:glycosyltransferase 2 family protein
MQTDEGEILKNLRAGKIVLPVLLGLSVAMYLLLRNFDIEAYRQIEWSWHSTLWIGMALLMMVIRDYAYMVRIRVLTDHFLTWRNSFNVIMLWEFSSAVAPAILGGGFIFAIFIINREKVNMGKSITAVMFTSFLDGIFLAVMAPLVYFIVGKENLFSSIDPSSLQQMAFGRGFFYSFWTIYFLILAYKLFVAYALFVNPRFIKWLLIKIFSLPLLKKWKQNALTTGNQLVIASAGLQKQNLRYWVLSLVATFASWTARYSIVNCIILAFNNDGINNLIIYGRQVIMGIIMLGSPTPGGSGVAEFMFSDFLGEFIPLGLAASLGLLWRLISYYPYLFVGAIILPRWIRKRILNS